MRPQSLIDLRLIATRRALKALTKEALEFQRAYVALALEAAISEYKAASNAYFNAKKKKTLSREKLGAIGYRANALGDSVRRLEKASAHIDRENYASSPT